MFDFVLNNPTIYDEKDIDNILFELMWEEKEEEA